MLSPRSEGRSPSGRRSSSFTIQAPASAASGLGSVLKNLTRPFKTSSQAYRPKIVGGASNMQDLMNKLGPENAPSERITAAELLRASVDDYAVSSVPEIWHAARDMLDKKNIADCRRSGLRLLRACIENSTRLISTRMLYFYAIVNSANVEDFDLQLECLVALTQDGRDISDIMGEETNSLATILCSWIDILMDSLLQVRSGVRRESKNSWSDTTENKLLGLMKFTSNVLKFNFTAFSETQLIQLIDHVVTVCKRATMATEVSACMDLFDTLLIYGYIPMVSLQPIIEIICGIYPRAKELREKAWKTIYTLAHSFVENNVMDILMSILKHHNAQKPDYNTNTMRGAARFLFMLSKVKDTSDKYYVISVSEIFESYNEAVALNSQSLTLEIVQCIYEILDDPELIDRITFDIWQNDDYSPLAILFKISEMDFVLRNAKSGDSDSSLINDKESKVSNNTGAADAKSVVSGKEVVTLTDTPGRKVVNIFHKIFAVLARNLTENIFKGPRNALLAFFIDMADYLDDSTALVMCDDFLAHYYCNPLHENWMTNCEFFMKTFLSPYWGAAVNISVLNTVCELLPYFLEIISTADIYRLIELILHSFCNCEDEDVFKALMELGFNIGARSEYNLFALVDEFLKAIIQNTYENKKDDQKKKKEQPIIFKTKPSKFTHLAARTVSRLFMATFEYEPKKARSMYFLMIDTCFRCYEAHPPTFIEVAKVLVRIRTTAKNSILITNSLDVENLASGLKKNPSSHGGWSYSEGEEALNEGRLDFPALRLKRRAEADDDIGSNTLDPMEYDLDVNMWFNIVLIIYSRGAPWESYSFVICHFGSQLSNLQLFDGQAELVRALRQQLSQQIEDSEPAIDLVVKSRSEKLSIYPPGLNKYDVIQVLIRTMTGLIPFSMLFTKKDNDQIVQSLVTSMSSERTAVACIHALVVCAYEIPSCLRRFLEPILDRLQTRITTKGVSVHILEFLMSLARLPKMANFTQDLYKQVFGIAFKYIAHGRDLRLRNEKMNKVDQPAHRLSEKNGDSDPEAPPQYLLSMAQSLIAVWFLTLPLGKRQYMVSYITRNFVISEVNDVETIDEASYAILDMITRYTYSDSEPSVQYNIPPLLTNGEPTATKSWLYGDSIVQIETAKYSGKTQVVIRRASGTDVFKVDTQGKVLPDEVINKEKLGLWKSSVKPDIRAVPGLKTLFDPSYFLLQVISPPTDVSEKVLPIPIKEDRANARALNSLDLIPTIDFHKIGVVYIGPGQHTEQEILGNTAGSKSYRRFLQKLGRLVLLKNNRNIYSGGLDTENDLDGRFAYVWSDQITQIVYHTLTLMPTPEQPTDASLSSKKRHVGNDFVSIYFDESGLPFNFDVLRSQFNFINIVITPHTVKYSDIAFDLPNDRGNYDEINESKRYYKVRAYTRERRDAVFAACHTQLISQNNLPVFVRNLALVASQFAVIRNTIGQYNFNWQYRLQQIRSLKTRVKNQITADHDARIKEASKKDKVDVGLGFLDQLNAGSSNSNEVSEVDTESESGPAFKSDDVIETGILKQLNFSQFA